MVMLRMMMVMVIMMMAHKRDSNSDVKSCTSSLLTSLASLAVTKANLKNGDGQVADVYSFVLRSSMWDSDLELIFHRLFNLYHIIFHFLRFQILTNSDTFQSINMKGLLKCCVIVPHRSYIHYKDITNI